MWDRHLSLPNVWVRLEERLFLDLGTLKTDTCNSGWLKMPSEKEDLSGGEVSVLLCTLEGSFSLTTEGQDVDLVENGRGT